MLSRAEGAHAWVARPTTSQVLKTSQAHKHTRMRGGVASAVPAGWIQDLLLEVEPHYKRQCEQLLQGHAFSFAQAWQDWYLFHNIFSERTTWGQGVYVDIGTNHPTEISNTLFFDKCLGWKGVCFEPQTTFHAGIKANRSCTLVPSCVVGSRDAIGGRIEEGRPDCPGCRRLVRGSGNTCVVAGEVLQRVLGNASAQRIDLLSIDIEGMEPEVLNCFPFDDLQVYAILIETNKVADMRALDRFFHRHGYVNYETFTNSVMKGYPNVGKGYWMDNLYVRRKAAIYPPQMGGASHCRKRQFAHRQRWCTGWNQWAPQDAAKKWKECKA